MTGLYAKVTIASIVCFNYFTLLQDKKDIYSIDAVWGIPKLILIANKRMFIARNQYQSKVFTV